MAFSFAVHLFVRLFACWLNIWRLECLFRPEERREESLCHGVVETSRYGGIPIPTLVYLSYTLLMFFFFFSLLISVYILSISHHHNRRQTSLSFFCVFSSGVSCFLYLFGSALLLLHLLCSQVTITVYFFFFYISQFPQFHYSVHRSFYISVH